jgi:hypothetical protein
MALGPAGPGESVLEVLSGSPFGMSFYHDGRAFFAPPRWTPESGLAGAMDLLGFTCDQFHGDPDAAVAAIRAAPTVGPVLVGPVEMGLLPHHPGLGQPIGADHYLVALGMEGDLAILHDPRAHPYAAVPIELLLAAWQTETLSFPVEPYNVRTNFRRVREVDADTALRRLLPFAASYVDGELSAAAAERTADLIDAGLNTAQYFFFADFMVCAAARRRGDAAVMLDRIGASVPAKTLEYQARLIGSMEYPLVSGNNAPAAAAMRKLAPTFEQLRVELDEAAATYGDC